VRGSAGPSSLGKPAVESEDPPSRANAGQRRPLTPERPRRYCIQIAGLVLTTSRPCTLTDSHLDAKRQHGGGVREDRGDGNSKADMSIDVTGRRTIPYLICERAARYPDRTYLVVESRAGEVTSYTYAAFLDTVQRAARVFRDLGIRHGDAVVLHLGNRAEFLFAWFGLAWVGAIMVPSNLANTSRELKHILDHSEALGVVTSPAYADTVAAAVRSISCVKHQLLTGAGTRPETWLDFDVLLSTAPPGPCETAAVDDDVAEMLFTSGTTAAPKAVMLTHANFLRTGERASRAVALDETDRCLTALPLFHINAQQSAVLPSLTVGASCVLLEEYHASTFWEQVRTHRATCVSLVAMQVRTLLAQPARETDQQHSVRRARYSINVLTEEKERFERRFGVELLNQYGLSEAVGGVTSAPVFGEKRWPSIGLPAADLLVRIVDENDADVPIGEVGEIVVQGQPGRAVMKGYFKDPEATEAAFRGGWLHTGDQAYADEDHYLYFVDRKKDVIKRAGENVSASEVEAVLLMHPLISEAAVIGVPDDVRDEAIKAFVVPGPSSALTVEDIREHCARHLARFKIPTIIEFRPSLPKTSIGKVAKKVLRDEPQAGGATR
jgi:carnitine-CoA ligase